MEKKYLSPINSQSVVQSVIDRITEGIIEGELKPGDQIPTEHELSSLLNVSRNTVREAIRILIAYGVLEVRRAEGTFVCDGFSTKMLNPAIYTIILQKEGSYEQLIGLRKIIENGIMLLIKEQGIEKEEWNKISERCNALVCELEKDPVDVDAAADRDIEFHNEIARATHNDLVLVIHDVVVQLSKSSRYRTIEKVIEKGDKQYLIDTHKNLLDKLKGENIEELYAAINNSYFYWKDIYR